MNNSTIKIELSEFFSDERQKVILMLNPKWTTVGCLQKRVEELFELDDVRFLNNDNFYIPPQESIEVIKHCAGLKAFVLRENVPKSKSKMERKKIPKSCESEESEKQKTNKVEAKKETGKRKYFTLENGINSSTPNNTKRIKNDVVHRNSTPHSQQEHKPSEISSTSEQLPQTTLGSSHSERKQKKSKSRNKQLSGPSPTKTLSKNEKAIVAVENNDSKRDLELASDQNQIDLAIDESKETIPEELTASYQSSTLIPNSKKKKKKQSLTNMKNPFKTSITNTNHIYYDEAGEITTTTTEGTVCSPDGKDTEENYEILLHCVLKDMDSKLPRIFPIKKQCKDSKSSKKPYIDIQENILLNPYVPSSLGEKNATGPVSNLAENKKDINESNLNNREAQRSADEVKDGLNDTSSTIDTAIDKFVNSAMEVLDCVSTKQFNVDDSLKTNGHNVSASQTVISDINENNDHSKLNESSNSSVDCVDLSKDINDNNDSKIETLKQLSQDDSNYDSSDVEEISEIIDLNDSEDLGSRSRSCILLSKVNKLCTKATELPSIGDIVVFKVPYQTAKGIVMSTGFLAGQAQYIHNRTKTIKLLILDGLGELYKVPLKYHTNLDDDSMNGGRTVLQLKFTDMIDPQILGKNNSW